MCSFTPWLRKTTASGFGRSVGIHDLLCVQGVCRFALECQSRPYCPSFGTEPLAAVNVNAPARSKEQHITQTMPKQRDSPDKEAAPVPVGRDIVPLLPVPGHLRAVPLEALPQQVLLRNNPRHWCLGGLTA